MIVGKHTFLSQKKNCQYCFKVQRKACKIELKYAIMKSDTQRGDKYGIST